MAFTTICPNCDASLTAPDTVLGKKVKCKKCDEPFVARPADEPDDEDERPAKPTRKRPVDDDNDSAPPRRPANGRRPVDQEDKGRPRRRRRDDGDDDEPRSRAQKKGKKKQGSSVLLTVLLILGALVMAGGAVGAYYGFIKEDKPADQPVAEGGGPKGLSGGPMAKGGPPMPGVGGAWVEQHDADGRYRVKFPSTPQVDNLTQQTPAGPVTLKVYVSGGPTEAFISTHQQLPADRGGLTDDQILEQAIEGAKQQAKGATAGPTESITYQSHPGRQVTLTFAGKKGAGVIRVILADDRVIALSAMGNTASADAPRVKQFFESLKIE